MLFIVGLSVIFASALRVSYTQQINIPTPQLLHIKQGDSLYSVCENMIQKHYINDCYGAKFLSKLTPQLGQIKAGVYQLTPELSFDVFLSQLNNGKEQQFAFTVLEGDNIFQVLEKIAKAEYLLNDVENIELKALSTKLSLATNTPEGWLYPETYYYSAYTKASELLTRAVEKQKQVLTNLWLQKQDDLPIETPYQALILASIVEKESAVEAERELIASVFHNRLIKKMRLQTDPTVIYGVWHEYDGDITRKHLKQKTPYNTYRINGLPPSPIANPSRASIQAVLHPATTDYYYFVASGDGGHVFNTTFDAHKKSLRAYLNKTKS